MKRDTDESFEDFAERHVLPIEKAWGTEGDEELRAVGVFAVVGHGDDASAPMTDGEVLVVETVAVDADSWRQN